jgi:small subunit ribosomal protein S20
MPVTKTAKRALRGSKRKAEINKQILTKLEVSLRSAKKSKSTEKIREAISLSDRAAKKKVIHKNRAARIKSGLSNLLKKTSNRKPAKPTRKSSK